MNSPPQSTPVPSGLILIDKPADLRITSTTVVRAVKRKLMAGGVADPNRRRSIRVGHAGTLDPLASGLLIVLVGSATKLCNTLMCGEKTYITTIDLSRASDTDDLEGELTENPIPPEPPPRERIDAALAAFVGTIQQRPPAFSAMWVDGKRAYDLARKGKPPTLEARPVVVHSIELTELDWPRLTITVRCGKGTYIRSLARDLGLAITGHAGCLTALRRTTIGPYTVAQARTLDSLPEVMSAADLVSPKS